MRRKRRSYHSVGATHGLENNSIIKMHQMSKQYHKIDMFGENNVVVELSNGKYDLVSLKQNTQHANGLVRFITRRHTQFKDKD